MSAVEGHDVRDAAREPKSLSFETLLAGYSEIRIDDARDGESRSLPPMHPIEGSTPDVRDVLTICKIDPQRVGRITGEVQGGVLRLKIEGIFPAEER